MVGGLVNDSDKLSQAIEDCFKSTTSPGKITMKEWKKWVLENRQSGLPLVSWIYENIEIDESKSSSSSSSEEGNEKETAKEQKSVDLLTRTIFTRNEITFLTKQYDKYLEQRPYYAATKKGLLDRSSVVRLFSPLSEQLGKNVFSAITKPGAENVDMIDLVCGLSMCARIHDKEKLRFIFKIFDTDRDGKLKRKELQNMIKSIWHIQNEINNPPKEEEKKDTPKETEEDTKKKER